MHILTDAIILAVRAHGEHGAVARLLTPADGLQPGYVRGGRSRRIRPVLQPANLVLGEWRARTGEQLAGLTVELVHSRAALFEEPLPAAALQWATALAAAALPDSVPDASPATLLPSAPAPVPALPDALPTSAAPLRTLSTRVTGTPMEPNCPPPPSMPPMEPPRWPPPSSWAWAEAAKPMEASKRSWQRNHKKYRNLRD